MPPSDLTAFGNDFAEHWAAELMDVKHPEDFLENTLFLANDTHYLNADHGAEMIAAAAVIAAACGRPPKNFPPEIELWLQTRASDFRRFAPGAKAALARVRAEASELREIRQARPSYPAWLAELDAIEAAL